MTTNLVGLLVCLHLCVRVPLKAGEAVGQRELLAFVVRLVMGTLLSKRCPFQTHPGAGG